MLWHVAHSWAHWESSVQGTEQGPPSAGDRTAGDGTAGEGEQAPAQPLKRAALPSVAPGPVPLLHTPSAPCPSVQWTHGTKPTPH